MELEFGLGREWLVANGLGGYASSTIIGCNTRKYHGLLVASMEPPVKRTLLLSKLEEEVDINGKKYMLSTNEYMGAIHPQGHTNQTGFELQPFPHFEYLTGGLKITKDVFMIHGHNATTIIYSFKNPDKLSFKLKVHPLITSRSIHKIGAEGPFNVSSEQRVFTVNWDDSKIKIGVYLGRWEPSNLKETEKWYRNLVYRLERERGYPYVEDLYCPGHFVFESKESAELRILASGGSEADTEKFSHLYQSDTTHFKNLMEREKNCLSNPLHYFNEKTGAKKGVFDNLIHAADSFIVIRKKPPGKSIIAGYPWFTDFGRDAFISLPGLSLVTGRFEDSKGIIRMFNASIKRGLVPNNFSETGEPNYQGVDATLWFIYAIQKHLEYTNDKAFVKELTNDLKAIIRGFIKGNEVAFVDEDGLVSLSKTPRALTWMDVNIDGRHATPRFGKVVEINALWYNALRFIAEVVREPGEFEELAKRVHKSFNVFWNKDASCLYDFVYEDAQNASIRPNQLFALSLPYSPLDREKGLFIVEVVKRELLTPYGLRSLSRTDPDYRGSYKGDQRARDLAYHQGTVWSWFMGPFITACVTAYKRSAKCKLEAKEFLKPLLGQVSEAGLGSISEVFDAEPPHLPGGCISQAWSVGEILRAYCEDIIEVKRPYL